MPWGIYISSSGTKDAIVGISYMNDILTTQFKLKHSEIAFMQGALLGSGVGCVSRESQFIHITSPATRLAIATTPNIPIHPNDILATTTTPGPFG
jgi:hypothetical protein